MKGLLMRDFYYIRAYAKTMVFFFLFIFIFGIYLGNPEYSCMMILFCVITFTLNTMAADENAGWNAYALTMPVARKTMVKEKYLVMLIVSLIGLCVNLITSILMEKLIVRPYSVILFCILASIGLLFLLGLIIPVIYWLGISRGRYLLLLAYSTPVLIGFFYARKNQLGGLKIIETLGQYSWLLAAGLILELIISYKISIGIYSQKEW